MKRFIVIIIVFVFSCVLVGCSCQKVSSRIASKGLPENWTEIQRAIGPQIVLVQEFGTYGPSGQIAEWKYATYVLPPSNVDKHTMLVYQHRDGGPVQKKLYEPADLVKFLTSQNADRHILPADYWQGR